MGKSTALLFLLLAQFGWTQDLSPELTPAGGYGDLVVLGSVPESTRDPQGNRRPQAEYKKILAGGYKGNVFEIECLPFSFDQSPEGYFRYWAYRTDETGFGWIEDEPLIVVSKTPASLVDADGKIRALTTLARVEKDVLYDHEKGLVRSFDVPVFEIVEGNR